MALATQVTFDCSDPDTLAGFWAAALGYELQAPPPPFTSWDEALDAWGVPEDQRNTRSAGPDRTANPEIAPVPSSPVTYLHVRNRNGRRGNPP